MMKDVQKENLFFSQNMYFFHYFSPIQTLQVSTFPYFLKAVTCAKVEGPKLCMKKV